VPLTVEDIIYRLKNDYYFSRESFKKDVLLILNNSGIYNGEMSPITLLA